MISGDYSALSTDSFNVGNDVSRQNQQLDSFSSVELESLIQSNYSNTISGFDLTNVLIKVSHEIVKRVCLLHNRDALLECESHQI